MYSNVIDTNIVKRNVTRQLCTPSRLVSFATIAYSGVEFYLCITLSMSFRVVSSV